MKKTLLVTLFIFSIHQLISASTVLPEKLPAVRPEEVMLRLPGSGNLISLKDYLLLSPGSYKQLTGKKMTLGQKIDLRLHKYFARKAIRPDGTVNIKKLSGTGPFNFQWHWGGFALGFFLSFLGPIIALFFNDDYKWDRFWTALRVAIAVALIALTIFAISAGPA